MLLHFKRLLCIFFIGLISGCAKFSYVIKQGQGQLAIDWKARKNKDVLKDPAVSEEHKRKIRSIEKYKDFFYNYFEKRPTNIYSKTTLLDREAVSYLVIASPAYQIRPIEHSFPIMGSFPYIGFFNKKNAYSFASKLNEEGLHTYTRPVYAYSTLNQWLFDDKILSSFFVYDEGEELAELIFHELFHTIYFVKNEIELNENLAQYFARELVFEYYKYSEEDKKHYFEREDKKNTLSQTLVELASDLNERLLSLGPESENSHDRSISTVSDVSASFLDNRFYPKVRQVCEELELSNCWPLRGEWNNARFAAFLTYESQQDIIREFAIKQNLEPREFYVYLEQMQSLYIKGEFDVNKVASFTDILFQDKL